MRQKLGLLPAAEFHFLAQSKMFTFAPFPAAILHQRYDISAQV